MKLLATEKFWNMAGAIFGVIVLLVGIIFMCTPADTYHTNSADSATFGADYYTYQYEATKIVAGNTAVTANNLRELGEKLATYAGFGFVVAGILIILNYGKKLAMELLAVPEVPVCESAPEEPVAEPDDFVAEESAPL